MTPEAILAHSPRVLTQEQRERYFATGFLAASGLIPDEWLELLRARSREFIEKSRDVAQSNEEFDIGPEHRPDHPHVRRLRALVDRAQFTSAAQALSNVPTTFEYDVQLPLENTQTNQPARPSLYGDGVLTLGQSTRDFNVADQEGQNGLDFVSAHDPRLVFDTTLQTQDGLSNWYLPLKFKADLSRLPLATGLVEPTSPTQVRQAGERQTVGAIGEDYHGGFCFRFGHHEGFEGPVVAPVPEKFAIVAALNAPA